MPQAGDKEDTFLISVSNGGNPIPKDMQEKIFEPFVQIKNTEKETAGSGIGLPLARSLAEMHAGKLYLKKGNEICFCVELPVKQEKTIRLQKENTEVAAARPGISQHKTDIRILIVEDDMEMQDFICKQISGMTASCLIDKYVMKDIEYMMTHTNKSIKEIAADLNFSNLSFFGKYMRKHFGLSPRAFRAQALKKA